MVVVVDEVVTGVKEDRVLEDVMLTTLLPLVLFVMLLLPIGIVVVDVEDEAAAAVDELVVP